METTEKLHLWPHVPECVNRLFDIKHIDIIPLQQSREE